MTGLDGYISGCWTATLPPESMPSVQQAVWSAINGPHWCKVRDPKAYLRRVIKNRLIDIYRVEKAYQTRYEPITDTCEPTCYSYDTISVREALEGLTTKEQEIVRLRWVEGYTRSETARIVGLTRDRLRRVEGQLREWMADRIV